MPLLTRNGFKAIRTFSLFFVTNFLISVTIYNFFKNDLHDLNSKDGHV